MPLKAQYESLVIIHCSGSVPKRNDQRKIRKFMNKNMLSEISQAMKDKYHMISPISGT